MSAPNFPETLALKELSANNWQPTRMFGVFHFTHLFATSSVTGLSGCQSPPPRELKAPSSCASK